MKNFTCFLLCFQRLVCLKLDEEIEKWQGATF